MIMSTVVDMTDVGKVIHDTNEIVRVFAGDTLVYNADADYTYTTFTVGMHNGESGYLNIGDGVGTNTVDITEIYINDVAQILPSKDTNYVTKCSVSDGDKVKIKGDFILQRSTIHEIRSFKTGTNRLKGARSMFQGCAQLTAIDLSDFNTASITIMDSMFSGCSSLTTLNLSSFNTSNVTHMGGMFDGCSSLTTLNLSSFNTSSVKNMESMFRRCSSLTTLNLSNFNTSNVEHMYRMFSYCTNLETLNISTFVTSNVSDIRGMFDGCSSLTTLDLSHFNLDKCKTYKYQFNGSQLFYNCSSLTTINLSGWGEYISGTECDLSYMFNGCTNLTNIIGLSQLKISKLSASGLTETFEGCSSLTEVDLSDWTIQYVYEAPGLFGGCTNLVNIKWPETIMVGLTPTYVAQMFYNCAKLTNIPEFIVDWYTNRDNYIESDYKANCFTGCTSLVTLGSYTYSTNAEAMAQIPVSWGGTKTE